MNEINTLDQHAVRREKLENLRENGNAYPNGLTPTAQTADLHSKYHHLDKAELEEVTSTYSLAGRIMQSRHMGKAAFMHIQDASGRIQIYLRKQDMDAKTFDQSKTWDLGDIIFVEGRPFKTQKGELSLYVASAQMLTKSLHPLPDKYHGLSDKEACYRMRYLDLMVNQDTRERFQIRSKITQSIRDFLTEHAFLEVETPMMHQLAGGAAAKPFLTHHNTLDLPLTALPQNYISNDLLLVALIGYLKLTVTLETKAYQLVITPSSRCWNFIKHTQRTKTSWFSPKNCSRMLPQPPLAQLKSTIKATPLI